MTGKRLVLIIIAIIVVLFIAVAAALVWSLMTKFEARVIWSDDDENFQTYKRELIEATDELR